MVEASRPSPHGLNIQLRIRWGIQGVLKVMVVGEGLLSAARFGSLPAATLSRWRSSRTLVEASHPSPHGQNI
ncbi:hypothetical protein IGC82_000658 [Escherichia coli]|nr:hypothetical protein [Escherichia coli]